MEVGLFLCLFRTPFLGDPKPGHQGTKDIRKAQRILMEVEVVRTKITLACTECKNRNYNTTKDKKAHPDRMETKKYCRFCKTHTLHKGNQIGFWAKE